MGIVQVQLSTAIGGFAILPINSLYNFFYVIFSSDTNTLLQVSLISSVSLSVIFTDFSLILIFHSFGIAPTSELYVI